MIAVIADGDLVVRIGDRRFEQAERFAGYDERIAFRTLYVGALVANQAVCIGGHALHALFIEFKEYPGHGRAQVVGTGCEKRFIDGGHQCIGRSGETGGIVGYGLFREIVGIFAHHLVFSVIAGDLDPEILVDVEGEGLIGKIFQRVDQDLSRYTDPSRFFRLYIHLYPHHGFEIGRYHSELILIYLKQKILQDGQDGIGVDHTGDVLKLSKQGG